MFVGAFGVPASESHHSSSSVACYHMKSNSTLYKKKEKIFAQVNVYVKENIII